VEVVVALPVLALDLRVVMAVVVAVADKTQLVLAVLAVLAQSS
jgi:hypothetical protein